MNSFDKFFGKFFVGSHRPGRDRGGTLRDGGKPRTAQRQARPRSARERLRPSAAPAGHDAAASRPPCRAVGNGRRSNARADAQSGVDGSEWWRVGACLGYRIARANGASNRSRQHGVLKASGQQNAHIRSMLDSK